MADPAWTTDVVEEVLGLIGDHVCVLSADWPKALDSDEVACDRLAAVLSYLAIAVECKPGSGS